MCAVGSERRNCTTKEVAALLRVKERKIYELVADKAIPASRVTGKLLFPRSLIKAWVQRNVGFARDVEALKVLLQVVAGSHVLSQSAVGRDRAQMIYPPARSEADVALAVAEGNADAGPLYFGRGVNISAPAPFFR